jgi:hypothetical protein
MRFHVVLTNLDTHIFTIPPKFHGAAISNHNLKFVDFSDIAISFLENVVMNKIMGVATVNEDDELPMLNVTNDVHGLGSRESSEKIHGNSWFNFWGV